MATPDLSTLTPDELAQVIDAARLRMSEIDRASGLNEAALRDAAAVDAEIAAVASHANRMSTIMAAPTGASPAEVEVAVKWLAEALYQVGALSIRAARLAAGRTQTAETLPGV